jgi:hypothetical protein
MSCLSPMMPPAAALQLISTSRLGTPSAAVARSAPVPRARPLVVGVAQFNVSSAAMVDRSISPIWSSPCRRWNAISAFGYEAVAFRQPCRDRIPFPSRAFERAEARRG